VFGIQAAQDAHDAHGDYDTPAHVAYDFARENWWIDDDEPANELPPAEMPMPFRDAYETYCTYAKHWPADALEMTYKFMRARYQIS